MQRQGPTAEDVKHRSPDAIPMRFPRVRFLAFRHQRRNYVEATGATSRHGARAANVIHRLLVVQRLTDAQALFLPEAAPEDTDTP